MNLPGRLKSDQKAFTIVELLIVIVLIGILAGLVLSVFQNAQLRARNGSAQRSIAQIEEAIFLLAIDTGKWPNGCPPDQTNDPESFLADSYTGLVEAPPAGIISSPCQWEASEVAAWNGPYFVDSGLVDPWGNEYQFDPDFYPYNSCPSIANEPTVAAVVSFGPDGTRYTCDDVFRVLND